MRYHFIAIGGSAMHNLAIALKKQGHTITGSDDEIFEPALSKLKAFNILPRKIGWYEANITHEIDAVILGMHAKIDNPELIKAKELNIKIFSFPEFLYNHAKDKKRIVIGGSHGKTTITAIILHVLKKIGIETDFMVGAPIADFDVMVKLSNNAKYMVLEGDEYLTSAIDRRPKFHVYKPDIALVSGIAWDHINVFPTFENYIKQFEIFISLAPENGTIIYCKQDKILKNIVDKIKSKIKKIGYNLPNFAIKSGKTIIKNNENIYPIEIFGEHNLLNIEGAKHVCCEIGVSEEAFYQAVASFKGAARRLEKIYDSNSLIIFRDFAHSPSKVSSTVMAVKKQFPNKRLYAIFELHTYSSLNKDFLKEYENSMNFADYAAVFYSKHALQLKQMNDIDKNEIANSFNASHISVFNDKNDLEDYCNKIDKNNAIILLMSSGDFEKIDFLKLLTK